MHRPLRATPPLLAAPLLAALLLAAVLGACSSGSGGSRERSPSPAAPSRGLVARTDAARVPLLDAEGAATHTHTQLEVRVNGRPLEVPAGIGIDEASGRIAALHSHDTTGLMHVESPTENDSYTLEQFLTVWGLPADPAGRCKFFGAASPCTISVRSQKSGPVDFDAVLEDRDTLELNVTS